MLRRRHVISFIRRVSLRPSFERLGDLDGRVVSCLMVAQESMASAREARSKLKTMGIVDEEIRSQSGGQKTSREWVWMDGIKRQLISIQGRGAACTFTIDS